MICGHFRLETRPCSTAGKIKIPVIDLIGASGSSIDTSLIPFLNQNNTFTGAINTFTPSWAAEASMLTLYAVPTA